MSIQYAPVVYPTQNQFKDFHKYMEYLEKTYSQTYGIVKIVPPTYWKPTQKALDQIDSLHIPGPIEQNAYGRGGIYECAHVSQKAMTVADFKKRTKAFEHFTDDLSEEAIETQFWKNVSFSPPLYAADIDLNLMDQNADAWNLNSLESVLTAGMKHYLPGVNRSYCYFGSWKSFFCWHTEDMELSAINFLHSGKPKFWYGIAPHHKKVLQDEARHHFPTRFQKCPEYLRHKTTLINPYKLINKYPDLLVHKQVQYPGEFIIAFNGAYHSGFNSGFNIAQAVNYATLKWLKDIKVAKYCKCLNDTVRIVQNDLACQLITSRFKDEPTVIQFYESVKPFMFDSNTKLKQHEDPIVTSPMKRRMTGVTKSPNKSPKTLRHKKIQKKSNNKPKDNNKSKIKSDQFEIENWAQCEKCKKWRKINFKLKRSQRFNCKVIKTSCSKKEESSDKCITL